MIAGAIVLVIGGVLFYAREETFDPQAFGQRAAGALDNEEVASVLSDELVDQIIERGEPDLINARPLITTAAETVLGSAPFRTVFREAAERAYNTVFTRERDNLVLNLADGTSLVIEAAESFSPKIAARIPRDFAPRLRELVESDSTIDFAQFAEKIRLLGLMLPILGLVLLGSGVALSPDRRRGFVQAAIATAAGAGIAALAISVTPNLIAATLADETLEDAARAIFDAFFGDLERVMFAAVIVALVLAAAARTRRRVNAGESARRLLAAWGRLGESRRGQALRALAATAVGALILLSTSFAVLVFGVLVGCYALFWGLSELLLLVAPPAQQAKGEDESALSVGSRVRRGAVVAAALGLVALILVAPEGDRRHTRDLAAIERCNGFSELCDRRIDEVAFAGVHNAMSAADDDFLLPNNQKGIRDQLEAGVRALLIDAHWGLSGEGPFVATDFQREGGKAQALENAAENTSQEFVDVAERLTRRIAGQVDESTKSEVFWCHVFCEIGATPGVTELEIIKRFVQGHPDEVLIVFIEDHVPPQAIDDIFKRSGLINYVYTLRPGEPLPTLREMIASDRRVLVMAEQQGGDRRYPWYHEGFALTQETPYTFHTREALGAADSCLPKRGRANAPLFQLNHWVEAVPRSPRTGAFVNSFDFLRDRAQRCQADRNLLPNIVGVDFWERGDLLEVVQVLNGLPRNAEPSYARR